MSWAFRFRKPGGNQFKGEWIQVSVDSNAPAKRQRNAQAKPRKKRKVAAKRKKPKKRQRKDRWVITAYFDVMASILIPNRDAQCIPLVIHLTYDGNHTMTLPWMIHRETYTILQNSSEINELDTDKKLLKIWTRNSQKQKSYSILKMSTAQLIIRVYFLLPK